MAEHATPQSRRRIDPAEDDWRRVRDPKKRKQIQDRLAQRARRNRLRELQNNTKQTPHPGSGAGSIHTNETRKDDSNSLALINGPMASDSMPRDLGSTSIGSDLITIPGVSFLDSDNISHQPHQPTGRSRPSPSPPTPLNVFSALYINGRILGLSCTSTMPSKSVPASDSVPLPLHPTALQLITVHHHWIDFFPFPKMRDNAISMGGIVDEEEFCGDLFTLPSFVIVPGRASWDPRGWKMERRFAEKWGYLFY